MAAAQGLYAETTVDVTNATHPTYTDCASISAGSFTANKEYLIIANALIECSGGANEHHIRLRHGTTDFTDADAVIDPGIGAGGGFVCSWMYRLSQGASPEAVTLQCAGETGTITVLGSQIFALKLSDDFTENTDFYWNEVTADYTTTTSMASQASATFTPNGSDTWLILGQFCQGLPVGLTNPFNAQLNDSVAGAGPGIVIESEDSDAGDENRCMLLAWTVTPSAASHTFSLQFSHGSTTAFTVFSSRILALKLNKFSQFIASYTAGSTTPSAAPSWSTVATGSVTPSVTGNWFYLASYIFDVGTATAEQNIRLQDDNSGSLTSDPAYGDDGVNGPAFDATDDIPMALMKMKSLTSGASRTINLDATNVSGTGAAKMRSLVGFSLELAAAGSTYQLTFATTSASTTPSAALPVARALIQNITSSSTTPNTSALPVDRLLTLARSSTTTTNDTVALLRTIAQAISLSSASSTADTATLLALVALALALSSSSSTPDTAVLPVDRALALALSSSSSTPDTSALLRAIAQALALTSSSSTPDTVELTIAGIISLVFAATSASTTPDTAALPVARALALALSSSSSTPDTIALLGAIAMVLAGASQSSTPDAISLPVSRALTLSAPSSSATADAALAVARALQILLASGSLTPSTAVLATSLIEGLISIAYEVSRPGATISAAAPGATISARQPAIAFEEL